ncbi:hypothetical protein REMIM1_PE00395 (plasmid) [Rhizobium etli bv. mimosae str. Mim1]|nr:hypothetical protein REMIM1_PE00395 [Rhizobium etli bv. mimosae str. Mim1]
MPSIRGMSTDGDRTIMPAAIGKLTILLSSKPCLRYFYGYRRLGGSWSGPCREMAGSTDLGRRDLSRQASGHCYGVYGLGKKIA